MINPDALSDEDFWVWFNTAPSHADVSAWVKPTPVDLVASWRKANPDAKCSDAVARALAEIEAAR